MENLWNVQQIQKLKKLLKDKTAIYDIAKQIGVSRERLKSKLIEIEKTNSKK